jgi:hypothetical protein
MHPASNTNNRHVNDSLGMHVSLRYRKGRILGQGAIQALGSVFAMGQFFK